jgi:amino acid transporter
MGFVPHPAASTSGKDTMAQRRRSLHSVNPLRVLLFGRPIATEKQDHARLPKFLALPVFSSDAISSVAYATQQILLAFGAAGLAAPAMSSLYSGMTMAITFAICFLLIVVVTSYWQTIYAYPSGGGSYIVSKDNIGVYPGLIAAAALLIDYVLTVAVSIASGMQNLLATPLMQKNFGDGTHVLVSFCVAAILLITYANLRGLKESGAVFAGPTYSFILMAALMVILGIAGTQFHLWHLDLNDIRSHQTIPPEAIKHAANGIGLAMIVVALRAFANGCSAMTGTEAVSNGIPAFKKPESHNAALTLVWMAIILGSLLMGISWMAARLHVVYWEIHGQTAAPVIDQLSGAIFGKHSHNPIRVGLYYAMQFTTTLILIVAAQTSYADFPRLTAILARDRFMPRQLANQADKLVFSNGIWLLGLFAIILVVAFHGSVDRLIPLYAVGVFTAFTLSQSGMVVHWRRLQTRGWHVKAFINGLGAICTFIVLTNIIIEKAPEGAWIVIVVAILLVIIFRMIDKHYAYVRRNLSIINWKPDQEIRNNTVLLMMPSLHRGVLNALAYARILSDDCRAIHIEIDKADTPRIINDWEKYVGEDIPLVILPSPYRSLIGPLMAYLDQVQQERPDQVVTVVVPEFVSNKWYHTLLHNSNGILVKYYLSQRPDVVVCNVRYFLAPKMEPDAASQTPVEPHDSAPQEEHV